MIHPHPRDPEEAKRKAEARAERFYQELEQQLKYYSPEEFGTFIARNILNIYEEPSKWSRMPIHFLLHSIEANCAYFRGKFVREFTRQKFITLLNHYITYHDPYIDHSLTDQKNIDLAMYAFAKQQFWLQRRPSTNDIARTIFLFADNTALPKMKTLFKDYTSITFNDWILMCFLIMAFVNGHNTPRFSASNFLRSEVNTIPEESVIPFLQLSSISIKDAGEKYREYREGVNPIDYIFVPSVFSEYPLLLLQTEQYLLPHPNILKFHMCDGLYRLCHLIDQSTFLGEFSNSFQNYVGRLLDEITTSNKSTERNIQEISLASLSMV